MDKYSGSPNDFSSNGPSQIPKQVLSNVQFYNNEIPAYPNREHIEDILINWPGNYELLERNHSYIQWLFPNRLQGMNRHSKVLTDEEVKIISSQFKNRVRMAFVMMLDFYGIWLTEDDQFKLADNSDDRLRELNRRGNHNFLRISRILLALKELGHKHLMLPWMKCLANLIFKEKTLDRAEESFEMYWIKTLDTQDQDLLNEYINKKLQDMNTPKGLQKPFIIQEQYMDAVVSKKSSVSDKDQWGYYPAKYSIYTFDDDNHVTPGDDIPTIPNDDTPTTKKDDISGTQKDDISGTQKDDISGTQKDDISASQKDDTPVAQKDYTPATHENNTPATQKDDISGTQKDDISATQKDDTPATQENNTPATQKDDTPTTQKDISGTQKDDISGTQKDDISATQKDDISATQKDDTPAIQKDDTPVAQKDDTPATQENNTPATHKDDTPTTQKDDISATQKDDISATQKHNIPDTEKDNIPDTPKDSKTIAMSEVGTQATLNASSDTNQAVDAADPTKSSVFLSYLFDQFNFN